VPGDAIARWRRTRLAVGGNHAVEREAPAQAPRPRSLAKGDVMEPLRILETASVLLAIAALGGLAMAGIRLSGKPHPPTWLAMLHGFLAAAAVTLLIYGWATVGLPGVAMAGTALFAVAAVGGAAMNLGYHWRRLPLPLGLMIGHAVLAIVGYVLLLIATFRG